MRVLRLMVNITPDLLIALGDDLRFLQGQIQGSRQETLSTLTAIFLQDVITAAGRKSVELVETGSAIADAAEQVAQTLSMEVLPGE